MMKILVIVYACMLNITHFSHLLEAFQAKVYNHKKQFSICCKFMMILLYKTNKKYDILKKPSKFWYQIADCNNIVIHHLYNWKPYYLIPLFERNPANVDTNYPAPMISTYNLGAVEAAAAAWASAIHIPVACLFRKMYSIFLGSPSYSFFLFLSLPPFSFSGMNRTSKTFFPMKRASIPEKKGKKRKYVIQNVKRWVEESPTLQQQQW